MPTFAHGHHGKNKNKNKNKNNKERILCHKPLLTAPNWKTRMLAAWSIIGGAERALAAQLDYSDVHNYWPSVDFCEPDWDEEVKHWASCLTSYDDPSEFNICSWLGSPPRPGLVFKV
ncbi:hypothetical protein [Pseudomonas syringae]|uniref:Uncharacterized protein n=1 Tax=Pseudomonas syringae pv. syringae (strain B728a) TaxID=205918 RepID=Q4ZT27_PSEU2|nr:hypothetical protein [Pseudomonas syringae]AAY37695.1 hypothetical protein Psyr_2656 [Pseudomonas syringae pv. syringae B728a]PYD09543.1 hypothetical protein DND47_29465 [Pseudomonas syringae pv. syringae]